MSQEPSKELARNFIAALDRHDLDAVVAVVAPDLVNHTAIPEAQGALGLRRILEKTLVAFPDQRVTCDDVIAEGDRVVCRVTTRGTHTGPLTFVRWPLPATGRAVTVSAVHIFRISGGKIAEHWGGSDGFGMIRQLGLAVGPEAAS